MSFLASADASAKRSASPLKTPAFSFTLADNCACDVEFGTVKIISDTTESGELSKSIWNTSAQKPSAFGVKLDDITGGQTDIAVLTSSISNRF